MLVDAIYKYLAENKSLNESLKYEVEKLAGWSFKRQFQEEKDSKSGLSLSGCGACPRKLGYRFHGIETKGKEMDARGNVVFFMGDMAELMVLGLARASGLAVTATGLNQVTCSIKVGETEIKGHPDGILFKDGETFLIECKSMADHSFKAFEKGDIDYGYECQINAYLEALNLTKCVIVAVNKNNGVLGEKLIVKSPEIVKDIRANLLKVLKSTPEKLPERMYSPNDDGFLPWQCCYCPAWKTCWPEAEQVLVKNAYKLKVKNNE